MTDHKFTDEENILSLLKFCDDIYSNARLTPEEAKSLLDLINRQKAEIERLTVECAGFRGSANSFKMHYENAKADAIKEYLAMVSDRSGIAALYSPHTPVVPMSVLEYYSKEFTEG